MITLDSGAEKHEKLFPKADLKSQIYKMEEEFMEFDNALIDGDLVQMKKELADCVIVSWGLNRFLPRVAWCCYIYASDLAYEHNLPWNEILNQVEEKWRINESRTWEFDGKVYHHVGIDGNE